MNDNRLAEQKVKVMNCPIVRVVVVEDKLVVCGKEGMVAYEIAKLKNGVTPLISVACSPSQKCFNSVVYDKLRETMYLGCENGSVVGVDVKSGESKVCYEGDVEEGVAILDMDILSSSVLFLGCSNASVLCFDLDKSAVLWRINLSKGEVEKGGDLPELKSTPASVRCTNVKVDPTQKWLLCGCGGNVAKNQGGFVSLWHVEAREAVSAMPMRGCPSGCGWAHGEIILCGSESAVYQYSMKGTLSCHSTLQNMPQVSDMAIFQHPDDLIGSVIALCGNSDSVVLLNGVGRTPFSLKVK